MGRHRVKARRMEVPEVSPRGLYGLFTLLIGMLLILVAFSDYVPQLSPMGYIVGGGCLAAAIYEFTADD